MIIKTKEEVVGTPREIFAPNGHWISRRYLLAGEGMGFSFHETIILAGTKTHIHYQNHLEAVFCVQGRGEVELIPSGERFLIEEGVMYALDKHDEHYLSASEEMRLICVFNPPLQGDEVHDEKGVYPLKKGQ